MELPEKYLDVLKLILEDIGEDTNSKYVCQKISAHLLLSSLYRVTVFSRDNINTMNFIFKCLRGDPEMNDKFDTPVFFKNESMFYTVIVKEFEEFQKRKLDRKYTPFQSYPKFFKALCDGKNDVIVLEDLTKSGYSLLNRFKVMDIPELFLTMRELGRFHALSLAIKNEDPEAFSHLKMAVRESVFYKQHIEKSYGPGIAYGASNILKLVKDSFPPGSVYITKFEAFATDNVANFIMDFIPPREEDEQFNVLTHGDLWINNLFFHYEDDSEAPKKPDKMCFVDFQQCRYGSLGLDVSAVLFLLMDQETRDSYRDELLRAYHQSLCTFLRQLGCDAEKIFPYSALEVQISRYSLFNLGLAFTLPFWLDEGEGSDADITVEDDDCLPGVSVMSGPYRRKSADCCKRILDVVKECVDRGYLG